MELHDVVTKLIGPVDPVGSTETDSERFENLKALTQLTDELLCDIRWVADHNKDRHEASMKKAGKYADEFMNDFDSAVPAAAPAAPDALSRSHELLRQALEALDMATNGLGWYQDMCPQFAHKDDDEANEQIAAAIAAITAYLQKEPT